MISMKPKKNLTLYMIAPIAIVVVALVAWLFLGQRLEFGKPSFTSNGEIRILGSQTSLNLTFADAKSGLAKTEISLVQDGKTIPLSTMAYPPGKYRNHSVSVVVDAAKLGLREGPAVLHITAKDNALFSNSIAVNRPVTIDFGPPQIFSPNMQNHINPGGTCVVVYRVSEPVIMTGITVDQLFFKAYPITLSGKPGFVSYFAMPMDAGSRPVNIRIVARDQGGNEASMPLPYLLMKETFRSDTMATSESFLQQKMPEFQAANPQLRGKTLLETFMYVNTRMREENNKTIQNVCRNTTPRQLWNGTFLRMKNASPMALFGDRRTYLYDGKPVGESIHMGVDLASTSQAPIEAANSGIVAYTGPLGIYGNAVIIDHGLGLFTLYSHLSSISVKSTQPVSRGGVIGTSGLSGLAGGDHLHFGMIVGDQFVNPQEWWDPHWIQDNVLRKMAVSF